MRKVFFVYVIRYLSLETMRPVTYFSKCTQDSFYDSFVSMSNMIDVFHKDGFVIVKAQVFKKVIEL